MDVLAELQTADQTILMRDFLRIFLGLFEGPRVEFGIRDFAFLVSEVIGALRSVRIHVDAWDEQDFVAIQSGPVHDKAEQRGASAQQH